MRTASGRMYPHTVDLVLQTWQTDIDGGRQVSSSVTVQSVACLVLIGKTDTVVEDADETGTRRVTQIRPTTIHFPSPADLHSDDLINWTDSFSQPHTFRVTGFSPPADGGNYWVATCVEGDG